MLGANIGATNAIEAQRSGLDRVEAGLLPMMPVAPVDGWSHRWLDRLARSTAQLLHPLTRPAGETFVRGRKLSDYQAWVVASLGSDPAVITAWITLRAMDQDGTLSRLAQEYRIQRWEP